jgi:hypothetical protein
MSFNSSRHGLPEKRRKLRKETSPTVGRFDRASDGQYVNLTHIPRRARGSNPLTSIAFSIKDLQQDTLKSKNEGKNKPILF